MENKKILSILLILLILPGIAQAQSNGAIGYFGEEIGALQEAITNLYNQQKGAFGNTIFAVSNILALGIILYILNKIFTPLLSAEPIVWASLIKPFTIFFLVLSYPVLLNLIELTLSPLSYVTESMSYESHNRLLQAQEDAYLNSPEWQMYIGSDGEGDFEEYKKEYGVDIEYDGDIIEDQLNSLKFSAQQTIVQMEYKFRFFLSNFLNMIYQGAILCINFIRTFYLIILAILGPVAIAITLVPGMANAPFHWLGQFITKWLWLPIANILAAMLNAVQTELITGASYDPSVAGGDMFTAADFAGLIFMMIGVVSFFCVPSVASMAMQSGGAAAGALAQKTGSKISQGAKAGGNKMAQGATQAAGGAAGMAAGAGKKVIGKIRG